jgi:uncharacterized membrane protein YccC
VLRVRRPDRTVFELALRAAVGAGLALWFGTLIGLEDPYWGAVSAVVATAGTLGASLGASVQRITATLIALAIGLGFAALPWSGAVVSAAAVGVTYLVMIALGLDAGARLAAASTLIVTAIPGASALDLGLSRGLNVPLGCLIAVGVGLVVFPHRASTQLRAGLAVDAEQAVALAADAVLAYLADQRPDVTPPLLASRRTRLEGSVAAHRAVLRDAGREPGSAHHLADLDARLGTVDTLLDDARGLVHLAAASAGDTAPDLVAFELRTVARALAAAAPSVAGDDPVATDHQAAVTAALRGLDHAFADVRHRLGTVGHSTGELARLLSVMRRVHGIGTALTEGGPPPPG